MIHSSSCESVVEATSTCQPVTPPDITRTKWKLVTRCMQFIDDLISRSDMEVEGEELASEKLLEQARRFTDSWLTNVRHFKKTRVSSDKAFPHPGGPCQVNIKFMMKCHIADQFQQFEHTRQKGMFASIQWIAAPVRSFCASSRLQTNLSPPTL